MGKFSKRIQEVRQLAGNFGKGFAIQCLVRRALSFSIYERYIYRYLDAFFTPIVEKFAAEYDPNAVIENSYPNKIWTSWWQGEDCAPELVKVCIESQRKAFASLGTEVIVLTKDNWNQYIDLPQHIMDKLESGRITITHFSDILRAELLKRYGGLWIDATVFCTKPIDTSVLNEGLFTVKCHDSSEFLTLQRWSGFLFGDRENSKLFTFMAEAFSYYWQRKDALVAYLLIDYIIAIAYAHFSDVREQIDDIPTSNKNLWCMLRRLNQPYEKAEWDKMIFETTFLKLSYKAEFNGGELYKTTGDGQLTNWGYIAREMNFEIEV